MNESSPESEKDIRTLLEENQRLLQENNQLLKRMRRNAVVATVVRLLWFGILILGSWYAYQVYLVPNVAFFQEQATFLRETMPENSQLKAWYEKFSGGDESSTQVEINQ